MSTNWHATFLHESENVESCVEVYASHLLTFLVGRFGCLWGPKLGFTPSLNGRTNRRTDRKTDRRKDKQTDRQTDGRTPLRFSDNTHHHEGLKKHEGGRKTQKKLNKINESGTVSTLLLRLYLVTPKLNQIVGNKTDRCRSLSSA